MQRPQKVQDAIELNSDGHSIGRYGEYTLRSAGQPIYQVREDGIAHLVAYEGLARPERSGLVLQPEPFFESLDQEDLLFMECMCIALHIRSYRDFLPKARQLFVNVNVANFDSIASLEREAFYTLSRLEDNGLNSDHVVFEILETEIYSVEVLTRICEIFRSNNIRFALDDFGTKSSNVERYLRVRPDIVKLDRALFYDFVQNRETASLLRSLIHAFRDNGAVVLMEGLETADETMLAIECGVDLMQGFFLGRPNFLPGNFAEQVNLDEFQTPDILQEAV